MVSTITILLLCMSTSFAQGEQKPIQKEIPSKRSIRHSKNITKIKLEDYKGDLDQLPKGAFIKKESTYNVKTGERITQKYVILPKKEE